MSLEKLAAALAEGTVGTQLAARRPPQGRRASAVLAAFTLRDDDTEAVVLTQRADGLRKHAGQVAFPGGVLDPGETDVEAALREAWEEAGILPEDVHILGALPALHIPVSGFDVVTVVGWWKTGTTVAGNINEVASVQVVPVDMLVDPDNRCTAVTPQGVETPGFKVGHLFVWGFTAFVLSELLRAGGWEKPWNTTKVVPVPHRLLWQDKDRD